VFGSARGSPTSESINVRGSQALMLKLEEIAKDAQITGLVPDEVVKVVNVVGADRKLTHF
jgi:hypothetical protein